MLPTIKDKPSPKAFQKIWHYLQLALEPPLTCNHTRPGPAHPASSLPRFFSHWRAAATITIKSLYKLSEPVSGSLCRGVDQHFTLFESAMRRAVHTKRFSGCSRESWVFTLQDWLAMGAFTLRDSLRQGL